MDNGTTPKYVDLSTEKKHQGNGSFDMWKDVEPKPYDKAKAQRDAMAARVHKINSRIKLFYVTWHLRLQIPGLILKIIVYSYVFYLMFS